MNTIVHAVSVGSCGCGDFGALYPVADSKVCKWCMVALTK